MRYSSTVEARVFELDKVDEIAAWCGGRKISSSKGWWILCGRWTAVPGDYIVRLANGSFTVAEAESFEEIYSPAPLGHKAQRQVREFHQAMGQPVGDGPRPLPAERVAVRVELIREEFIDELIPALGALLTEDGEIIVTGSQDVVEVADAAIDILYVVYGLLVEMGIDAEPLFDEVQRSNMSKLGEDGKPIIAGPNDPDGIFEGRVKKGPNYFKPDLDRVLAEQGWQGLRY